MSGGTYGVSRFRRPKATGVRGKTRTNKAQFHREAPMKAQGRAGGVSPEDTGNGILTAILAKRSKASPYDRLPVTRGRGERKAKVSRETIPQSHSVELPRRLRRPPHSPIAQSRYKGPALG